MCSSVNPKPRRVVLYYPVAVDEKPRVCFISSQPSSGNIAIDIPDEQSTEKSRFPSVQRGGPNRNPCCSKYDLSLMAVCVWLQGLVLLSHGRGSTIAGLATPVPRTTGGVSYYS